MVDRHSLSEPRYIGDLQWEVDVFRENVDQAVDTLIINSTTLPPRTRKGKVVWQLPKDPSRPPSFGTEDKKRIFEIFKERKKQRKKEKALVSKQASGLDGSKPHQQNEPTKHKNKQEVSLTNEKDPSNDKVQSITVPKKGGKKSKSLVNKDKSAPPDTNNRVMSEAGEEKEGEQEEIEASFKENLSICKDDINQCQSKEDKAGSISGSEPTADDIKSTETNRLTERPDRTFSYESDNGASISVAVAKQFVEKYYHSIQIDGGGDLVLYYTESAQKSISLGGAHSVVTGYEAIVKQLMSFRGGFSTRGIVTQDTIDGGVHLLVTGVYMPIDGLPCPFAHTVVLVPQRNQSTDTKSVHDYRFKIHNDALALISDSPMIVAPPVPPPPPLSNFSPFSTPQMPPPGFG